MLIEPDVYVGVSEFTIVDFGVEVYAYRALLLPQKPHNSLPRSAIKIWNDKTVGTSTSL
jgi:hypothetical protein